MSQVRLVGKNSLVGSPILYSEVLVNADNKLEVHTSSSMSFDTFEATLASGEDSSVFDCRGARSIRLFGTSNNATFLQLQFATVSSPQYDWNYIDILTPIDINGTLSINKLIQTPPPYIRIANTQGNSHQLSIRVIKEK